MLHRIRGGLSVTLAGAPAQAVGPSAPVGSVAVFGGDYPGMRTDVLVAQGDTVRAGQPLFRDRKRPGIAIVAPVAGHVARLEIGAKRRLSTVEIAVDGDEAESFDTRADDETALRALLGQAGLWTALIARPFGRIPDLDAKADAIFVTAIDTRPLAADPFIVLEPGPVRDAFAEGLTALERLTEGPVFVCQGDGVDLVPAAGRIRVEKFEGRHPAGLVGTHIDRLFPIAPGRSVWQIAYQDVVAIGRLLQSGRVDGHRVVALGGPGAKRPRLVRVPDGASLDDLLDGEMTAGPKTVLSGPPLGGRPASHLRRRDWQVSVLQRTQPAPPTPLGGWFSRRAHSARPLPVVPTAALDHALGPDLPVVHLVRALAAHDVESAEKLGAAGLLEEDLALVSYAAATGQDFGALLRTTLDALEDRV